MKKIKSLIFDNLHIKLISILISFLLWLNISFTKNTTFEFKSYVEIKNIPKHLVITKIQPPKVKITISSTLKALNKIDISSIEVYVDASNLKAGANKLQVKVNNPLNYIEIVDVNPKYIKIYTKNMKR